MSGFPNNPKPDAPPSLLFFYSYIQGCEGSFRYLQPSITDLISSPKATSDLIARTQVDQLEVYLTYKPHPAMFEDICVTLWPGGHALRRR